MDGAFEAQGLRPKAQDGLDAQLDREIEAALGIEPSPEFLTRVRMRVAAEPEASWWRPARGSAFSRSFEPMIAVALVGILVSVVIPRVMRNDDVRKAALTELAGSARTESAARGTRPTTAPAVTPTSIASGGHETPALPFRTRTQPIADSAHPDSVNTVPLQLSPVLFAEDERRFFSAFVAAVEQGQVPEKAIKSEFSPPPDVALVAIEPLVIAPLKPLARVAQEGEGQWE
jgi:hypothetical protein